MIIYHQETNRIFRFPMALEHIMCDMGKNWGNFFLNLPKINRLTNNDSVKNKKIWNSQRN